MRHKARIGLYSIGLEAYWAQFEGLQQRLIEYGKFIENQMSPLADVYNFGLVDNVERGRQAGEWFNQQNVDLVFCHSATYATSSTVLPIHQICTAPVIVLNLQPAAQLNYAKTTTGEWLAQCGACPVPEIANAFNRAGIRFRVINGLLGLQETPASAASDENTSRRPEAIRAWAEIGEWILAALVRRNLRMSRFGFLGNTYNGMLDMYSDFTALQAQTGIHVEVLEMCDMASLVKQVTKAQVEAKLEEVQNLFHISEDSPADPLAKRPSDEQLTWACTVAVAQERLVHEYDLDALAYYYHGTPGGEYERIQEAFILGNSLLTAKGIPCAGEGDLKTALAMKICDLLNVGGSFSEIVVVDYEEGSILLGHDGPFHIAIADGRPILRGMGLFHGKQGTGVSVEAKVKTGPITTLNVTQTGDGQLKLILSEGAATAGPIMRIGNTQTHVKFSRNPDDYMEAWFNEAPTHHCALSVGHNVKQFAKVADLLNVRQVTL